MAEAKTYSADFAPLDVVDLPTSLQVALGELQAIVGQPPRIVRWNDHYVGAVFPISVDLPAHGTVDGIDIREEEPVILVFPRAGYPLKSPMARSDRRDLPVEKLPHLNPTDLGQPPWLCLHRGSINDWFAEHSLSDFVARVRSWFRDAAAGRLIPPGDEFEHTRIVSPDAIAIFPTAALDQLVSKEWSQRDAPGFRFFCGRLRGRTPSLESASIEFLWEDPTEKHLDLVRRWNEIPEDQADGRFLVGLIVWASSSPNSCYFGSLPNTYEGLLTFARSIGVPLEPAIEAQAALKSGLRGVPILVAIGRPANLIGRDSAIEWLSFAYLADSKPDEKVLRLSHREPLTGSAAAKLASRSLPVPRVLLGAGALGSRIALHLARGGSPDIHVVDYSSLSPHHFVRHGLSALYVGRNKAKAVKEEIESTIEGSRPSASVVDVIDFLSKDGNLEGAEQVIDATASGVVLEALRVTPIPASAEVIRTEIAASGALGIVSREGPGRNPRVDDLQLAVFSQALRSPHVRAWLEHHREQRADASGPALDEIALGIGCSSITMKLADELVAHHASQACLFMLQPRHGGGELQFSSIDRASGMAGSTERVHVGPVEVLPSAADPGWEIRIGAEAARDMSARMAKAGRNETGGLMIGLAHMKRRTIYVTDILGPSPDSHGSRYEFCRGRDGYLSALDTFGTATGGLLGYVGEWHTHPTGTSRASGTDLHALELTWKEMNRAGLPTTIVIVGTTGMSAYVKV